MEWNLEYVISQVLTVLMYVFLGMTYYAKDRKKVLILSFLAIFHTPIFKISCRF